VLLRVVVFLKLRSEVLSMANEYKTHSFKKAWHDRVEQFLEENDDLAFDSPKYFIKFCVNKYMDEREESAEVILDRLKKALEEDESFEKQFKEEKE